MPRKVIVSKESIWSRRAENYARYFEAHNLAMQMPAEIQRNMHNIVSNVDTTLNIFGELDWERNKGRIDKADFTKRIRSLPEHLTTLDFLAPWVWSKDDWNAYVHNFNALEEPTTDFEMKYSAPTDRITYEPIEAQ